MSLTGRGLGLPVGVVHEKDVPGIIVVLQAKPLLVVAAQQRERERGACRILARTRNAQRKRVRTAG